MIKQYLDLNSEQMKTLDTYVNLMIGDKAWVKKVYQGQYVGEKLESVIVHDIHRFFDRLGECLDLIAKKDPVEYVERLKESIKKRKGISEENKLNEMKLLSILKQLMLNEQNKIYPSIWYAKGEKGKQWDQLPQVELTNMSWKQAVDKLKKIANGEDITIRLSTSKGYSNQDHYIN